MKHGEVVHYIGQLDRGGAERQLFEFALALRARGWKQTIVSFWPGGVSSRWFQREGFEVVTLDPDFLKVRRVWALRRLLARKECCIVHSWSSYTNVYAWLSILFHHRPWIASVRENPLVDVYTGRPRRRVKYARVYTRASCVIANSDETMAALREEGIRMKEAIVVGNITHVRGRAVPGEQAESPVIIAAGTLKPLKAYHILLQALAIVRQSGRSFRLLLAGEGPEKAKLQNLTAELGLTASVTLLGGVERAQELMAKGHLCVHPSLSEGLSNTILEAMAEGLPVIASSVGGNREIIADGVNGLLCPPGDPAALASAIMTLLDSPSERERLGKAGLDFVRTHMNPDTIAARVDDLYLRLFQPGT